MPKYKVNFKVAVQTDGWTNPSQDYDERIERGSVVVTAKNKTEARAAAVAKGLTYHRPAYWGGGSIERFADCHILSVNRMKNKGTN